MPRVRVVNVSFATFVRILAIVAAIAVIWALRDLILLIFFSMVLAATISPWVQRLERFRIPRVAGVTIVYCVIITVLLAFVMLLIPVVRTEATTLMNSDYYGRISEFVSKTPLNVGSIATKENVSVFSQGIFAGVKGFVGWFASFILVLVIAFYFAIDEENIRRFWIRLVPNAYRERFSHIARLSVERIGSWFRGQLFISSLITVASFIAFYFLKVPDALLLALIGGGASFIPVVGAVIGVVPAFLLALTVSRATALIVLVVGIAIHQLIANAVAPKVMSRAVGLNPVIIVIVMLLGAELAGGLGLLLAIPVASVIDSIVKELKSKHAQEEATHAV